MVKRDGVILEERYCNEEQNKIKHHRIPHNSKDLRHQRNPRALNPPDRTGLRNLCESVQSVGLKKNKFLIRATTSADRYCNEEQKWWSQSASYSKAVHPAKSGEDL